MRLLVHRAVRSPLVIIFACLLAILAVGAVMTAVSSHTASAASRRASAAGSVGAATASPGAASDGAASVETGAPRSSLPALSAEQTSTPEAFIEAVMTQVLTIDYARTSRADLQNWVDANQSIVHTAPSPPEITADMLRHSAWYELTKVMDTGAAPLVVSESEWAAYARAGATSSVKNVQVTRDPVYEKNLAAGMENPGPYVTARLYIAEWDITIAGAVTHRNLSLSVSVDLALFRSGYGLLAVL